MKADRSRRVCRAYYAAGDLIFREGDPATDFYVIEQGEVEILRSREDGSKETIAVLGAGDFFGEAALIGGRPRNATVQARTDAEVVVLGRNVFTQISAALTPLRDALATALKRRANIWRTLHDVREVLDSIPLKHLLEPIPDDPIRPDARIDTTISRINKERLDFCCVVNDEQCLVGIVTRSDLLRAIEVAAKLPEGGRMDITVADIMVKDPLAITMEDTTGLAIMTMREHGFKSLPVIESHQSRIVRGYVRIENIMDCVMQRLLVADPTTKVVLKSTNKLHKVVK